MIAIDDATGHARSGAKKYQTRSRKKVSGRQLQNTVGRVSRSRDLFLFGLIKKKGKRAGLPKRIRTYVRRGWVADTTRASKLQSQVFFFCSGSFFFSRKFVKSRWFFCALCAMQLRAWHMTPLIPPRFTTQV